MVMKAIDLRRVHDGKGDWWMNYLAYLASTPNNWVERCLTGLMNGQYSYNGKEIILTQDQEAFLEWVQGAGLNTQWTIVCLDGAPERMKHQADRLGGWIQAAQKIVAPAENRFAEFIHEAVQRVSDEPDVRILGNWRDGAIIGNQCNRTARIFVEQLARKCASVNTEEGLAWDQQFHVRAGVGKSLHSAFAGLLCARRDEASFAVRDLRDALCFLVNMRLPTGQSPLTPVRPS